MSENINTANEIIETEGVSNVITDAIANNTTCVCKIPTSTKLKYIGIGSIATIVSVKVASMVVNVIKEHKIKKQINEKNVEINFSEEDIEE